ncbi:MAG: DUF4386 domain-containing protein [Gemmatimonadota bacterium]
MTRRTNARVAGYAFLVYIAAGITSLIVSGKATAGSGVAAKLASVTQHSAAVSALVLLALVMTFSAVTLGVTLYALTRDQDRDIAMLGMVCRLLEGIVAGAPAALGWRWLAGAANNGTLDPQTVQTLGAFIFRSDGEVSAIFFAVGSTLFCWLFLRGRMIPRALAQLGVAASLFLVLVLPLQLADVIGGSGSWFGWVTWVQWLPMLVFEIWLAILLIVRGVAEPIPAGGGGPIDGRA